MPRLSDDKRAARLAQSRASAIAFAEDMEHIREVLSRDKSSRGEIRRLSAVLRRLLVEGGLHTVAGPRLQKQLTLSGPDRKPFYDMARRRHCIFFTSGGARLFGIDFDAQSLWNFGQVPPSALPALEPQLDQIGFAARLSFRLDNFLSQRVLCYRGEWATRRDVIKHVANFGGGVHDKPPSGRDNALLERMRTSCTYGVRDGVVFAHCMPELGHLGCLLRYEGQPSRDFAVSDLDALLVEVLAAARLLSDSPDVKALEELVWQEIEAARPPTR